MIALTTIKFEISKGGGVSNDVRVQPLRLFQIEYEVSNWDFSYSLKVAPFSTALPDLVVGFVFTADESDRLAGHLQCLLNVEAGCPITSLLNGSDHITSNKHTYAGQTE